MLDRACNVPPSIVYSSAGAESLKTATASNNPDSFSSAIKRLISCMSRQGFSNEKVNGAIQKFFNKHQGDFSNVCQSKQELLDMVS